MVENQKVSSNRQAPRRELTREERMRRLQRRRRAKRRKAIGIAVFTLTAIAILIAMILVIKNGIGTDKLHGVWVLDDTTSYEFDGKENGAMLISDSKYRFTYEIKKDKLFIDYESDILVDGEYTLKNISSIFQKYRQNRKMPMERGSMGNFVYSLRRNSNSFEFLLEFLV